MTKSNTALRAGDDPVLAAIEFTANDWQRFVTSCRREPKDVDGKAAILSPAYAKWQAVHDDICQDWDSAYTVMLATLPTTAGGAAALIDAFLRYERALGSRARKRCSAVAKLARLPGGRRMRAAGVLWLFGNYCYLSAYTDQITLALWHHWPKCLHRYAAFRGAGG